MLVEEPGYPPFSVSSSLLKFCIFFPRKITTSNRLASETRYVERVDWFETKLLTSNRARTWLGCLSLRTVCKYSNLSVALSKICRVCILLVCVCLASFLSLWKFFLDGSVISVKLCSTSFLSLFF